LNIVADERIAALDQTFGRHGELVKVDGRRIDHQLLETADALVTRTVTRVDRELLEGTGVRFAATATIGTDHFDIRYLNSAGIRWTSAPGCNADATAQYTLAMFLLSCRRLERDPFSQSYGIIGCGNVGGRLKDLLESLGIVVVACDPPLEAEGVEGFRPMSDVLACDAISLHVPLSHGGRWPTHHMFDQAVFERLSPDSLLINSCRGDVLDGSALASWLAKGGMAALDVWPGEPEIDPALMKLTVVATPHIAGYSLDGKLNATSMVYRDFCEYFGITDLGEVSRPTGPSLDIGELPRLTVDEVILHVCPVERDDAAMRQRLVCPAKDRVRAYDAMRSHYPARRDFGAWTLSGFAADASGETLTQLGFSSTSH